MRKITEADLAGKGVLGMPDTPGLSATDMQEKMEEITRDVVIPIYNENIDHMATPEDVKEAIGNLKSGSDMQSLIYDADKDGCVSATGNDIFEFSHTYENGVHKLTGHSKATTIKFAATARYTYRDTFEVNGTPMTAYFCGEKQEDGFFIAGVMAGVVIVNTDTNSLHF